MRASHLQIAQEVNAVPRYFRLCRAAATSGQTLDAATHWVWLWLPDTTDNGASYSKAAIRAVLRGMRTGEYFTHFPAR